MSTTDTTALYAHAEYLAKQILLTWLFTVRGMDKVIEEMGRAMVEDRRVWSELQGKAHNVFARDQRVRNAIAKLDAHHGI